MPKRPYKKELMYLEERVRDLLDTVDNCECTSLIKPTEMNDSKDWYRGAYAATYIIYRMICDTLPTKGEKH